MHIYQGSYSAVLEMPLVPLPSIVRRVQWEALLLLVIRRVGKQQVDIYQQIIYFPVILLVSLTLSHPVSISVITLCPTPKLVAFLRMGIVERLLKSLKVRASLMYFHKQIRYYFLLTAFLLIDWFLIYLKFIDNFPYIRQNHI